MEIRRFFVSRCDIADGAVTIRGDEFLHMTKVLRYRVGYKAVVCANDGVEHTCTVKEIGRDYVRLTIDCSKVVDKKGVSITLYAGLLKNNKLDFVIQKAVELGVDRIIPFTSANCAETKFSVDRAKQCGSAYLSRVDELISIDEMAAQLKNYDSVLFAYEGERKLKLSDALREGKHIALIVGPEGGFQPDEAENIINAGASSVTLGRRILRAETASIIFCALVLNGLGELD